MCKFAVVATTRTTTARLIYWSLDRNVCRLILLFLLFFMQNFVVATTKLHSNNKNNKNNKNNWQIQLLIFEQKIYVDWSFCLWCCSVSCVILLLQQQHYTVKQQQEEDKQQLKKDCIIDNWTENVCRLIFLFLLLFFLMCNFLVVAETIWYSNNNSNKNNNKHNKKITLHKCPDQFKN